MFVLKERLMNENEDRGDDLGANPFVGGDGETNDNEAEDRGDAVGDEEKPAAETESEAPADSDGADSDGDSDGADDADDESDAGDGEPDATGDDDEVDEEEPPASPMIPKKRFDAVNERMKRAEQRLEELERTTKAAETPAEEFDFDGKEKEYMEAVLDGDSDAALALRKEIRAAEEAQFEEKFSGVKDEAVTATKLQTEFDETVDTLEAYNPILDPDNEAFDEDLVDEIVALQNGLLRGGGTTPGAALMKAAKYVMGDKLVLDEVESEPAPEPKPKKVDVKEKLRQAKRQPADMDAGDSSSSAGEGTLNVDELSEKDFDALPESKKRELRGDVV